MNEMTKIKGIVSIFKQLADEYGGQEGLDEDEQEDLKENTARRMDFLFNPTWRLEILLGKSEGEDPFGGGWLPSPPRPSMVCVADVDKMYGKMRAFARNRQMARDGLEHSPEEMDHKAYANVLCPVCSNKVCEC